MYPPPDTDTRWRARGRTFAWSAWSAPRVTEAERIPPPDAQMPTSAGGRPGGTRPALCQRDGSGSARSGWGGPPSASCWASCLT